MKRGRAGEIFERGRAGEIIDRRIDTGLHEETQRRPSDGRDRNGRDGTHESDTDEKPAAGTDLRQPVGLDELDDDGASW